MREVQLIPISESERLHIADRIAALLEWYDGHSEPPPCRFEGDPHDLSTLSFISYELEDLWDWDAGETVSFVLGNVLVRRFSFQWVRLEGELSPRLFAVRNLDVPCIVFPWTRLYEAITSAGNPRSAAEDVLVTILSNLNSTNAIPEGWHPALDALKRSGHDLPQDVVRLIQTLSEREPNWIRVLGLFPYEWNKNISWDEVQSALKSMIDLCGKRGKDK